MGRAETVNVEVVFCAGPGQVVMSPLSLPLGATLADAVAASGLADAGLRFGIWGKVKEGSTVLRDGDRLEAYRPLIVDPKEARRQRYQRHKERAARA